MSDERQLTLEDQQGRLAKANAAPRREGRKVEVLDLSKALSRRDWILDYMQREHATWIDVARRAARHIAARNGTVTADDVREFLWAADIRPKHYNAWGGVFKGGEFEWTGEYRRSAVPRGKGNMQRVWRVRG